MAINKFMLAALKAISYTDVDIKKYYKANRLMENISHPKMKLLFKTWDHSVSVGDHEIAVRIFTPRKTEPAGTLLFFHGGGWVTGNIDSYNSTCGELAMLTSCRVLSVDYRLAPENPFPAAVEDCYAVARELFLNEPRILSGDITLIGDSAGGNIAAAVSLMARDRGEFFVSRQILIYPATYNDHSETSPFPSAHENGYDYLLTLKHLCDYIDLYVTDPEDWENPYFAPLLAEDLSNQPDTLIITAEFDPLRDEGEEYGKRLRAAGTKVNIVRVKNALHGFFTLPLRFTQVRQCYDLMRQFLTEKEADDGES